MKLYLTAGSGNAYKVRLLLSMLGVAYEKKEVDFASREHRQPAFLAINPRGQVPVLEDDGRAYWDSTACLVYIALKHGKGEWLPTDPAGMAEIMQWLALSNNELHYGLQWARGVMRGNQSGDVEQYRAHGRRGLEVLESRLKMHAWLALERPTIADVACYPYVAVAPEGVLSLEPYLAIGSWLERFRALPGWIPRL